MTSLLSKIYKNWYMEPAKFWVKLKWNPWLEIPKVAPVINIMFMLFQFQVTKSKRRVIIHFINIQIILIKRLHVKQPWLKTKMSRHDGTVFFFSKWSKLFPFLLYLASKASILLSVNASFLSLLHLTIFFVSVKSYFRFRFYLAIISLLSCFND